MSDRIIPDGFTERLFDAQDPYDTHQWRTHYEREGMQTDWDVRDFDDYESDDDD